MIILANPEISVPSDINWSSDVLHANRANISKDKLRGKLAELYKASKDHVNVFGLRTNYGGGKTTGFARIYDSQHATLEIVVREDSSHCH